QHVLLGHATVVHDQLDRRRRADPELVLLLADVETLELALDNERRDAAITLLWIRVREDDEHLRLRTVRDPQLPPVETPAVGSLRRARLQRERIGSGAGFGKR